MPKSSELKRLTLRQLDRRLEPWLPLRGVEAPRRGWVRAVREALGMGVTQFATRLKVKPPSVSDLENSEKEGTITLNSLQRAAEALDCTLVYALVPNTTLTAAVRERARQKARATRSNVSHSMALEAQGVDPVEAERQENELTNRLLMEWPRSLWDDDDHDGDDELNKPRNHGG